MNIRFIQGIEKNSRYSYYGDDKRLFQQFTNYTYPRQVKAQCSNYDGKVCNLRITLIEILNFLTSNKNLLLVNNSFDKPFYHYQSYYLFTVDLSNNICRKFITQECNNF